MRIILVTLHDQLQTALTAVLNPELEYCAILTDEIVPATEIARQIGVPQNLIRPMYEFQECISTLYYDCVLFVADPRVVGVLPEKFRKWGMPKDKLVQVYLTNDSNNYFLVDRAMRYFKEHAKEFEMFATGMSYASFGLDASQFKRKLFNFGRASQDLYYDYKLAKFALSSKKISGGRVMNIRYILIGLAPYSFHYDESKNYSESWRILYYYVAFGDVHNFLLDKKTYGNLFRDGFLANRLSLDNFDVNNVYYEKPGLRFMNYHTKATALDRITVWDDRSFPETRAENIKILDDYLTLCERNNVKPIMFLPPVSEGYAKHFNKQLLDEFRYLVRTAMKKHPSAGFLDGWTLQQHFNDSDFCDVDHMNAQGAAKFSAIFNQAIEQL